MEADNWTAPSGLDVRHLVWALLAVARAFEPITEIEAASVKMLLIDGEMFLEATEPED